MPAKLAPVIASIVLGTLRLSAQQPDLSGLIPYTPKVSFAFQTLRIYGGPINGLAWAWRAGFLKFHPDTKDIAINVAGGEAAVAGLYTGISDVGMTGDDVKIGDLTGFVRMKGHYPMLITGGTGSFDVHHCIPPLAVLVNRENPLTKVTMKQLDGIIGSERTGSYAYMPEVKGVNGESFYSDFARGPEKNIRTWGQLGLTGEWADKEIHTYGPAWGTSVGAFVSHAIVHWSNKVNPNYQEMVSGTKDGPDNEHVKGILISDVLRRNAKDRYSLGLAHLEDSSKFQELKALAVAANDNGPYYELTEQNVRDRKYALLRNVYVVVDREPNYPLEPRTKEFLRYILSREGQEDCVKCEYNALTPGEQKKQLAALDDTGP